MRVLFVHGAGGFADDQKIVAGLRSGSPSSDGFCRRRGGSLGELCSWRCLTGPRTGWDVPQYVHDGAEPRMAVSLHHCRDDDVVPFSHLASDARGMPSAKVVAHPRGGHQFDGLTDTIAADAARSG